MQPEVNIPDLLVEAKVHWELTMYVVCVCVGGCWRGQPQVPHAGWSSVSAKASTKMPRVVWREVSDVCFCPDQSSPSSFEQLTFGETSKVFSCHSTGSLPLSFSLFLFF